MAWWPAERKQELDADSWLSSTQAEIEGASKAIGEALAPAVDAVKDAIPDLPSLRFWADPEEDARNAAAAAAPVAQPVAFPSLSALRPWAPPEEPKPAPDPYAGRSVGSSWGQPAAMPGVAAPDTGTRVPQAGVSAQKGAIDNSTRQSFIRTAYPYALEAADGDPVLANQLVATAISENGNVGSGKDLGANMGFNVGGIQGVKGPAGSFWANDNGNQREFAAYNSLDEGFRAVRGLVSGGRYGDAAARYQQTGDVDQYWRDVNGAGYAEDPNWHAKVGSIRRNQVEPLTAGLATQPRPVAAQAEQTRGAQDGGLDVRGITEAYKGVPYTFGGAGGRSDFRLGSATDCSGFVANVWREKYGVNLPAHTDAAYNALRQNGAPEVAQKDARPGDVVFYMGAGTGGAISHHMGIYAGPGKVLDMSVSGGDGVRVRDVGHAGRFVILRDPRINAEQPRTAQVPPPIVPTGIAEQTGGEKLTRAEMARLSLNATGDTSPSVAAPPSGPVASPFATGPTASIGAPMPEGASQEERLVEQVTRPGQVPPPMRNVVPYDDGGVQYRQPLSDGITDPVSTGDAPYSPAMLPGDGGTEPTPYEQPFDPDQGPREATPGSVGAQPLPQDVPSTLDQLPADEELAPRDTRPYYGPETPATPAIGAAQNAGAGLEADQDLAPRPWTDSLAPVKAPGRMLGDAITGQMAPGGLLEPAGGAPRMLGRMEEIEVQAAQATGHDLSTPNGFLTRRRAVADPTWRAQNPELAAEYDELQQQFGLTVVGQAGDAARFPGRAAKPTVEVIQSQIDTAYSVAQRAREMGNTAQAQRAMEAVRSLESDLVDAVNARQRIEPAIRSDVGRRIEELPLDEQSADNLTVIGRERARVNPDDLSGPVGVPQNSISLNASPGALPTEATRSGILPAFNRAASEAIVGGTGGAVIEQARNPDEDPRTAAARGFAVGAVGFPLATRAARGAARLAGADTGTRGALATFGAAPAPDAPNRAIAVGADPSKRYEFRYRVADLSDLIPSNLPNGAPNPAFPRELQPRARNRAASQIQIDQIAQGLEPDALLNDVGRIDSGPMIVGADNIVESGNGRTLALQRAAANYPEQYQRYVADLRGRLDEYGLSPRDIEGVRLPVLVRERVSDVDRAAFAAEANNSGVLRMSSVEQAAHDAGNLSDEVVSNIAVGENDTIASALRKTENRDLVRRWVRSLPTNERAGVLDASGDLSAQGYERLTNAMLMRTYGQGAGERLARAFIESADPVVRNVQNALMASLPDMARAEALIRSGQRDAGLSIAEDVATAAEMLARLRREGVKVGDYLAQSGMFERELSPLQESILEFLDRGQRRPSSIREALKEYARRVENAADPNQVDMFGGQIAPPTREDLWRGATSGADIPDAPLIRAAEEADQAAGRVPADGAGLAPADAEPVARPNLPLATPREPAAGVARPRFARPGPVEDILPSTGGPEGSLSRQGGPSDYGMVPGTREGPPAPVPARGTPIEGYDPDEPLRLIPDDKTVRAFSERIKNPAQAEAAAIQYQRMVAEGASPDQLATFMAGAKDSRWMDRFDTLRYASMLSDPVTHGQNFGGSMVMGGVDILERPLTALLDMGRSRVTGGPRDAFMSQASAQVFGMAASAKQGIKDAGFIMAHGMRPEDVNKLDRPNRGFATDVPLLAPRGSRAANITDFAMEGPLRALSAADAFWRGTFRGGHLEAEATGAARRANGGKPVTVEQVRQYLTDPEVAKAAEARAAQAVLQEDRAITAAFNAMRARLPAVAQAPLSVAVPYVKTPYNIVAQGVGMTPAGVYSMVRDIRAGKPPREIERRVSRMLLGGAVMAWASWENLQGLNTGAYPEKESERSTLPPGWRPYSRKVQVGDETYYVPLAVLGPVGIPAMLSVLATEQYKKGGGASMERLAGIAEGVGKMAEDQTFLKSISDATDALSKGGNTAMNYVERQASQFSPHVIGGGGIGRRIQAIMGEPSRDPDGVVEAWLATLPYTADQVPPRRDVLGRASVTNPDGPAALIPIRASRENDSAVIRAYRKAGEGLPMRAPQKIRDPETDESLSLTRRQQDRWRVEFGRAVREEWSDQGNPTDKETLRKVEAAARLRAASAVLGR